MNEPEDNFERFGRCSITRLDLETVDPEDDARDTILGFHLVGGVPSIRIIEKTY